MKPMRHALWAATLLLAGCLGSMFNEPKVTLENVKIGGLGLQRGTLLVNVRVENPNRFSLNANQLKYELAIRNPLVSNDTSWIDFASGTYDQPFSVGARETKEVEIPVEFSYSGLGGASSALLRNGNFTYRARGTVEVRTPIGLREVPFAKRGTVSLLGGGAE